MSMDHEVRDEAVDAGNAAPAIVMVSPKDIAPSPFGPDVNPPATPADDLALLNDIKASGVKVPLTLGRAGGKGQYAVVNGTRRRALAIEAGIEEVPVIYKEYASDAEMRVDALLDNMTRRQFTTAQRAEQANHLWQVYESAEDKKEMAAKGLSPRKRAAQAGGISEGTLAAFRYVLDSGHADLIDKMRTGELSIDKAYREAKKRTEGTIRAATATKAEAKTAAAEQMKSLRASFDDLVRAAGILRDTVKYGKTVVKQARKAFHLNDAALLLKQIQAVNEAVSELANDSEFAVPCGSMSSAPAEDTAALTAVADEAATPQAEAAHA